MRFCFAEIMKRDVGDGQEGVRIKVGGGRGEEERREWLTSEYRRLLTGPPQTGFGLAVGRMMEACCERMSFVEGRKNATGGEEVSRNDDGKMAVVCNG